MSLPQSGRVRLALPQEAATIARLQQQYWAEFAPMMTEEMVAVWQQAITQPPLASLRVLVALADGEPEPIGFAVTGPSDDPDAEPTDAMIAELIVSPDFPAQAHLVRLLTAAVETLQADRFCKAYLWLKSTDDARRALLDETGWAADGAFQERGDESGNTRIKMIRMVTDISTGD